MELHRPVGGAADIFDGEHEKLRQFLVLFQQEIVKIRTMDDREFGVLFLLDSQHLFKRLLVHHDTREKRMLYPLLDEVTTKAERQELFARLEFAPQLVKVRAKRPKQISRRVFQPRQSSAWPDAS